jgi:hypothetical protein
MIPAKYACVISHRGFPSTPKNDILVCVCVRARVCVCVCVGLIKIHPVIPSSSKKIDLALSFPSRPVTDAEARPREKPESFQS